MNDPWHFEREARQQGRTRVAGVDEAGRGPLAGPVVAAAVLLPADFAVAGVGDSKKVGARRRHQLYEAIYRNALAVGIGIIDPHEIDRLNILRASLKAMAMALENLSPAPDFVLVDGPFTAPAPFAQQAIVGGDGRSISIGAASIVAKETRDRLMRRYHADYPQFGFDRHKGYPTRAHCEALRRFGPCAIHRCSFRGVRSARGAGEDALFSA
jgi:ribonuclease HII